MEIPSVPPLTFRDLGFEGGGAVEVISPDTRTPDDVTYVLKSNYFISDYIDVL